MGGSMIKRFFLTLAFLAGLLSPAFAAGTISLSLMQQFGTDNKPLNGGLLYFYAAGTTTPQNAYQDSGLTIPWPNPLTLGSTGRVPQLFFADGQIKVRLTNSAGVVQLAADNLLVVGPSGGGGGGGTVDPTTVLQTGDIKVRYGTGVHTGFVRQNGRTIGSATSGATERANADCQPLFEYLWGADATLVVSTGRGASANADWVANKTITLPDARNRAIAGLGGMGNSVSSLLTGVTFTTGGADTLGSWVGAARRSLGLNELPNHSHNIFLSDPGHTHPYGSGQPRSYQSPGFSDGLVTSAASAYAVTNSSSTGVTLWSGAGGTGNQNTTTLTGSGQLFDAISPFILMTIYIKL